MKHPKPSSGATRTVLILVNAKDPLKGGTKMEAKSWNRAKRQPDDDAEVALSCCERLLTKRSADPRGFQYVLTSNLSTCVLQKKWSNRKPPQPSESSRRAGVSVRFWQIKRRASSWTALEITCAGHSLCSAVKLSLHKLCGATSVLTENEAISNTQDR